MLAALDRNNQFGTRRFPPELCDALVELSDPPAPVATIPRNDSNFMCCPLPGSAAAAQWPCTTTLPVGIPQWAGSKVPDRDRMIRVGATPCRAIPLPGSALGSWRLGGSVARWLGGSVARW